MSAVSTDVKSVAEQVKERLSGTIAGLIPEEVWNQMIDSGVNQLLEPSVYGGKLRPNERAGAGEKISMLQLMIEDAVYDMAKEQIKTMLSSQDFMGRWNGQTYEPTEAIAAAILANKEALLSTMVMSAFGNVTQSVFSELRNNPNRFL
ncbi:hypothetical protein EVB87_012 [Rhizobium phage RHph_N28_1]|nr:hypothetical protein EVB87_012 [Rhizobium phage RHph_N28_1]QIG74040.1 hypothetical protein EVC07_012 [Rhizobium phage RHph_N42]QXV73699.1 hypothetical protein [Rhizobium phage RHph_N46]